VMAKNVVVCCDGTANQVVAGDDTNVVRLCAVAIKDPSRQIVYYGPGLGTMEAEGALTWLGRFLTRVAGLAFGYGIARDIRNAYAFIMAHYEPGDRLYLFGFQSRGLHGTGCRLGAEALRSSADRQRVADSLHRPRAAAFRLGDPSIPGAATGTRNGLPRSSTKPRRFAPSSPRGPASRISSVSGTP